MGNGAGQDGVPLVRRLMMMMMAGGLVSPARHRGTAHVPHCKQRLSGCDYVGKACVAGKGALVSTGGHMRRAKNN